MTNYHGGIAGKRPGDEVQALRKERDEAIAMRDVARAALRACHDWFAHEATGYGYGFFPGGDPRTFNPDPDGSTEEERQAWEEDCRAWNETEERGEKPGFKEPACLMGDGVILTRGMYGLGSYEWCEPEFGRLAKLCEKALGDDSEGV